MLSLSLNLVNALELKVPPLVLVLVLAGVMWFAAMQLPSLAITLPWRHGLAVTISGVGILFILAGVYVSGRPKPPSIPPHPPLLHLSYVRCLSL